MEWCRTGLRQCDFIYNSSLFVQHSFDIVSHLTSFKTSFNIFDQNYTFNQSSMHIYSSIIQTLTSNIDFLVKKAI